MTTKYIILHEDDNCATSLAEIARNEELTIESRIIKINQKIPIGHKFALNKISKGELIRKYGQIIGRATEDIKIGDWIHTHNIRSYYLEGIVK